MRHRVIMKIMFGGAGRSSNVQRRGILGGGVMVYWVADGLKLDVCDRRNNT